MSLGESPASAAVVSIVAAADSGRCLIRKEAPMRCQFSSCRTAFAAACLTTLSFGFSQSSVELHLGTAPFVGQTLTLELDGAAPASAVDLYFSAEPDSSPTPFGIFELRRETLVHLASGTTSASGTWSFDMPVALDPSLAETGAHFQALAGDPAASSHRIFSNAVHARFLGPRVYAGFRSTSTPHRVGMYIVSGVTDTVVARADFGFTDEPDDFSKQAKPVFDATYSHAAVMDTKQELALFDPFFGGVQARIAFTSPCSRNVLADASQSTVYVLQLDAGGTPARVHAIDLATGIETAHLDLPNHVEPLWCLGESSTEAFIAEHEASGRTAVRWIGLGSSAITDRGSVSIGMPWSTSFNGGAWLPMIYAGGQLVVSTLGTVMPYLHGSLTRCRVTPSGLSAFVNDLGTMSIYCMAAVPDAGRIVGGWSHTDFGPAFSTFEIQLATLRPPVFFASPTGEFNIFDIEPDGGDAWFLAQLEYAHSTYLFRLNVATHAWTQYSYGGYYPPADTEVLRDAWNHELWMAIRKHVPPVNIDAEIVVIDALDASAVHIPLQHSPEVLHAVPLP
jgi:hypothetical protein